MKPQKKAPGSPGHEPSTRSELPGQLAALAERAVRAGTWTWEIATSKLIWSDGFFLLFGLDPNTATPNFSLWRSRLHPEDMANAEERTIEAVRDRKPLFNRYRIVLPGGEIRWIDAYGDSTYDESGAPLRMSGFCIDVTERIELARDVTELEQYAGELRRAERELRDSQRKLQIALKASRQFLWDYDMRNRQFVPERGLAQIIGRSVEELGRAPEAWAGLLHPDDTAALRADVEAHLRGATEAFQSEFRLQHGDGSWVWVLCSGAVVEHDPTHTPVHLAGTLLDVSRYRRLSSEGVLLLRRFESLMRDVGSLRSGADGSAEGRAGGRLVESLTRRQRQTLAMIAQGLSSAQIAERLHIAIGTAITHRRELMRKLDLHSAADVTRFAIRHRIVDE